ncbi:unnamed protein product [Thelazia callipaeda]|uniref:C3H1-type domain-containing protein n=1 Tax=Thelazia callipaeda TaxID=103827 RepID=A0A0N5CQ96_THECL|nr:unnamed protein product [Thelazia callipaeda]
MPPDDPLGRYGPKLAQFLTKGNTPLHAQLCPYARKCTYGNKCKFYHPERPNGIHVSVTERLMREKQRKELLPVYDSQMKSTASESSIYPTIMRTQNLNLPMLDAAKKTSDNRKLMQNIVINSPRERSRQMPLHPHLALSVHQNTPLSRNWPLLSQNHHPSLVVSNSAPSPSLRLHSNPYHSSNSFPQPLCLPFTYNGLRYHNGNEPHQEIGSNALLSPHCFVPNSPAGSNNMCGKNNTISSQPQIPFIPAWNKSKLNSAKSLRTNQNNPSVINDRNQLQNILCQLFPKRIVLTVMDAFPDENDPRELCPRIIAQLRGSINNE